MSWNLVGPTAMMPMPSGPHPLAALRRFVQRRPEAERCELCSADLAEEHQHLIEPASRRIHCCCDACALLFGGGEGMRYRRLPRRVQFLPDFRMTDVQWEALHIPINLAFFFQSTAMQRVVAFYPSPAGATESLLTLEAWHQLAMDNPLLLELEPDAEALLVNRVGPAREYYRVPIDQCYKLVGLIRTHWRGLSGGTEVWDAIEGFLSGLKRLSGTGGEVTHA
jgi:hypothetical protein